MFIIFDNKMMVLSKSTQKRRVREILFSDKLNNDLTSSSECIKQQNKTEKLKQTKIEEDEFFLFRFRFCFFVSSFRWRHTQSGNSKLS